MSDPQPSTAPFKMPTSEDLAEYVRQALPWLQLVWEKKDELLPQLKRIGQWFRGTTGTKTNPRGILILGAGGCGKSTLGLLLSGQLDHFKDVPSAYTESQFTETLPLEDDPQVEIVIPPGQDHRRASTWSTVLADVAAARFRGIFIMNSYGYHTLGDVSFKEHRLYQPSESKRDFVTRYLADRREEEIRVLKTLAPHISTCSEKIWITSIVNKEDLWWNDRPKVLAHYNEGEYASTMEQIIMSLGPSRLKHEMVLLSLLIGNLETGRGEILAKNVSGYDSNRQFQSIRNALNTLDAVMQWEAS